MSFVAALVMAVWAVYCIRYMVITPILCSCVCHPLSPRKHVLANLLYLISLSMGSIDIVLLLSIANIATQHNSDNQQNFDIDVDYSHQCPKYSILKLTGLMEIEWCDLSLIDVSISIQQRGLSYRYILRDQMNSQCQIYGQLSRSTLCRIYFNINSYVDQHN